MFYFSFSVQWVTFYDNTNLKYTVHLDASLTALGGSFADTLSTLVIPDQFNNYSIVCLGRLNIMVALKIWSHCLKDQYIEILCDKQAVVQVFQTGNKRDGNWPPLIEIYGCCMVLLSLIYIYLLTIYQGKLIH